MGKTNRTTFNLECLEQRLLFSADTVLLPVPDCDPTDGSGLENQRLQDQDAFCDRLSDSQREQTRELIFIDASVAESQQLVSDLKASSGEGRYTYYLLDPEQDGIEQISIVLDKFSDLQAVHIIAHGDDAEVQLGRTRLSPENIELYTPQFKEWQTALHEQADILFYSCNLTESTTGQRFVEKLSSLTGADVAASNDLTGQGSVGGDWQLETTVGRVEADTLLAASWQGILATYTVTNTNDSGAGSFAAAINQANLNAGTDTIAFNISTNDGKHLYYQDNAIAGTLNPGGVSNTTAATDAAIADSDPDFAKSWYRIEALNGLPAISESIIIDGTTQAGYSGTPIIEIYGNGSIESGLELSSDSSIIRGLVINGYTGGGDSAGLSLEFSDGNAIFNNYFGTDPSGTIAIGNFYGLHITNSSNNTIGGVAAGEGNLIAGNTRDGIYFGSGIGNSVRGNAIFSNGQQGIDIAPDGVNVNDPGDNDPGPNLGQNAPVLGVASAAGSTVGIKGDLNSIADTFYDLDFYASPAGDLESGKLYLGSLQVKTDSGGDVSFITGFTGAVSMGDIITATATDENGNTSEFSAFSTVVAGNSPTLVQPINDVPVNENAIDTVFDLTPHFNDAEDGTNLVYTVVGNTDGSLLTATPEGSNLRLAYAANAFGTATVTVRATDTSGLFVEDSFQVTVAQQNNRPNINGSYTFPGTDEDTPSSAAQVSDILAAASITASDADGDTLGIAVFANIGNGTWQYSMDGGTSWTAFGAVNPNAALLLSESASIRYLPDGINSETPSFGFRAWDQTLGAASATGSQSYGDSTAAGPSSAYSNGSATADILVSANNDAPTLSTNTLALSQGQTVTVTNSMLQSADADNADTELTLTVSNVANGYFAYAADTTAAITSFTQDEINNSLVIFVHDGGELAPAYELTVSDGTLSTSASTAVVTFSGTADGVLWLSLNGNEGTASGIPGVDTLDLQKGMILQQAGPNFNFGAAATDGTFSVAFDSDLFAPGANINGIHYVTSDVQIGNSNSILLQAGDLILTTAGAETFVSNGAVAEADLNVDKQDLFIFRPDAAGDYSKGNFYLLLSDVFQDGAEVRAVSLVERPVWVGDRWLNEGDLLLSRSGGGEDEDIWLLETGGLDPSVGTSYPAAQLLLQGEDAGVDFDQHIHGLDILEQETTIGGQTYAAGTILVTFDNDDNDGIGSSAQVVKKHDIAAVTVTKTTLTAGLGNAIVDAVLLFDGDDVSDNDVNFDSGNEALDALSLTGDVEPLNQPPSLATNNPLNVPEEATRTITTAHLEATDPDTPVGQIVYTVTTLPGSGTLRLDGSSLGINDTFTQDAIDNNRVTYQDADEGSSATFKFTVSDGTTTSAEYTFSVNGQPINDAPVVTAPAAALAATEQTGLNIHGKGFSVSDSDEADSGAIATLMVGEGSLIVTVGDSLVNVDSGNSSSTVVLSGTIAQLNALLTGSSSGTIVYLNSSDTPSANTTLTVTVNDQGNTGTDPGTSGDGFSEEGSNSVVINIAADNDAPTLVNNSLTIDEDGTVFLDTSMLSATDVDDVDDNLVFTVASRANCDFVRDSTGLPVTVFTLADVVAGDIKVVHNGGEAAPVYSLRVSDGVNTPAPAPAGIVFNNLNDPPAVGSVNITATEDGSPVNGNFSVSDPDSLDTHAFTIVGAPAEGSVVNNNDGTFSFDPGVDFQDLAAGESRDVTVSYFATDDSGAANDDSPLASVTITVTGENDQPAAVLIDNTTVAENSAAAGVGNLSTSDVDNGDSHSYSVDDTRFEIVGAQLKLKATEMLDFETEPFVDLTVTSTDANGQSRAEVIRVNVIDGNELPIVADDNLSATEDTPLSFEIVAGLLGNDSDPEGLVLTLDSFTQPAHGELVEHDDGSMTYSPDSNYFGNDRFDYTVSDPAGNKVTGTALIVVSPVGDTPNVTAVATVEGRQSELIRITRNSADGTEVTHFRVSAVTGGRLYLADGKTEVHDGDFISVAQGTTGLRFTPDMGADNGSFVVESSEDGANVAAQSGQVTAVITVTPVTVDPEEPAVGPVVEPAVEPAVEPEVPAEEDTEAAEEVEDEVAEEKGEPKSPGAPLPAEPKLETAVAAEKKVAALLKPFTARLEDNDSFAARKNSFVALGNLTSTLKLYVEQSTLAQLLTRQQGEQIPSLSKDVYQLVNRSLDAVQEELTVDSQLERAVIVSSIATSVGLSAGYVIWLLQGGTLLTSVLASLPAWQLADPLSILAGHKADEDDDESLEKIIEEGAADSDEDDQQGITEDIS